MKRLLHIFGAVFLTCLLAVSAFALTATDRGVLAKTATLYARDSYLYRIGAGNVYGCFVFWYASYKTTGATNLVSLNLDTGSVDVATGPIGRPYGITIHPNGLIYLGTFRDGAVGSGKLASWNHTTGAVVALGDFPTYAGYQYEGVECSCYGDDANQQVFFGGLLLGGLCSWDPVLETVIDYGIIDEPVSYEGLRYIYSLQADANYVYCEIRQASDYGADNVNYLCVVDIATKAVTTKWKGTAGQDKCIVYRAKDESICIERRVNDVTTWYRADGVNDPIELGSAPAHYNANERETRTYAGYSVSTTYAIPWITGDMTLLYKKPGDSDWRTQDAVIDTDNYYAQRIVEHSGSLMALGDAYAPIASYNVSTHAVTKLGNAPVSPWSYVYNPYTEKGYIAGYDHALAEWTTGSAWVIGSNPALISGMPDDAESQRFYWAGLGYDQKVYLASAYTRVSGGSNFISYNPAGGAVTSLKDAETKLDVGVYDLASCSLNSAQNKAVLSLSAVDNSRSFLAVVPLAKKQISKLLAPLGVVADQGRAVFVGTDATNINHVVGITIGVNYLAYCVDIGTGEIIWQISPQTGKTSNLGPTATAPKFSGGYVWYYEDGKVVKLDPADGTITPMVNLAVDVDASCTAGQLLWIGNTLFHTDSATKKLWEITF